MPIESTVLSIVQAITGDETLTVDQPLMDAGIDSLAATVLVQQLSSQFDLDLPATTLFDHPSISSIAQHVASQLLPDESSLHQNTDESVQIIISHQTVEE